MKKIELKKGTIPYKLLVSVGRTCALIIVAALIFFYDAYFTAVSSGDGKNYLIPFALLLLFTIGIFYFVGDHIMQFNT